MKAKVKEDSRYGVVTAFSGIEFVKSEWRDVPSGKEEEARVHPFLLVQDLEVKPESIIITPVKKAGRK
jgi:hypothetical protein